MPMLQVPGARLSYSRTGKGPAVLLIQGVGIVGNGWRPQIDELSGKFEFVSFDNRGIGGSTKEGGALTIEAMAADALAIMEAEKINRFHVVGHSMGGVIAQEVALTQPQRVKSLSFLCTFRQGKEGARITPDLLMAGLRTRLGTRAMRRNAFLELVMPQSYLQQADRARLAKELEPLFGHDLGDQPPIVMQQLRAMARYDASDRLAQLGRIPTLVVAATQDRIALPQFGKALARAIPSARYVEIADAGHGVPIHSSKEINALLAEQWDRAESYIQTAARMPLK